MDIQRIQIVLATALELVSVIFMVYGLSGKNKTLSWWKSFIFWIISFAYILLVPTSLTAGSYVFIFLYIKWSYGETWKDSFIMLILNIILVSLVELVCYFPFVYFVNEYLTYEASALYATICCVFVCYFVGTRFPIVWLKRFCGRKEVTYTAGVVFSIILMIVALMNFRKHMELEATDYIYIIVALCLIWGLSFRILKYRYQEKIRKQYYDAFHSVMDQMKRKQHKFRNQLDAVYSLHKLYNDYDTLVEEQRKYLGKLTDYEMPTDVLVLQEPIVIAHVYEKISEAQEQGIRVRLKLSCGLEECGIQDIHMVEILGTFLDNAIQDMVASGQKEFLYIEVKDDMGIRIRIANPHEKMKHSQLQKLFEKGYSTKGEDRGIGLYHVKKLAYRYKAELMVENCDIDNRNYICFSLQLRKKHSRYVKGEVLLQSDT